MDYKGFTARAKKIIKIAHTEALSYGVKKIGDEFILLGAVKLNEGVAYDLINYIGIPPSALLKDIDKYVRENYDLNSLKSFNEEAEFSQLAQKKIEQAHLAALTMGHNFVGTEHLLLSVVKGGQSTSAKILKKYDVDYDSILQGLNDMYAQAGAQNPDGDGLTSLEDLFSGGGAKSSGGKSQPKTLIDKFAKDLTALAKQGILDPVINRQSEIERLQEILSRRTKNNPVLVGDPGVGKTAIVEGLAQRIISKDVPVPLYNKRILQLDLAALVAGTKYRGEFERRLKTILDEVKKLKEIIVFLDELHTVVGAGSAEGSLDAANILKPALSRGEIQCIGATTFDEYKKYIERDAALERRFQQLTVNEPSVDETVDILKGLQGRYEKHHNVEITTGALIAASKLSKRYITERFLPDKAIDLLDEACARANLKNKAKPPAESEFEEELKNVLKEKQGAVKAQDFEKAANLKTREDELKEKITKYRKESDKGKIFKITKEDIEELVSRSTGIPVNKIQSSENAKLINMEEELQNRVIGQQEAVKAVARAVRRSRTGLKDPKRPTGSFLFLGPTGVGKTELARALSEFIFGSEDALIKIDMSEFMEKFSVSRLVGAPPGYVGYKEGGQLTEAVRRRPFSVVLLDEIEKAHPDVFNILLQVFDEGSLSDNLGHKVDFRNAIIIMTTNVGAKEIVKGSTLGFISAAADESFAKLKEKVISEAKKTFNPEFLNRLDDLLVFHQLTKEDLKKIIDIMSKDLKSRLAEKNIKIEITDGAKDFLIEKGYDINYGARPIQRALSKYIEDEIAERLLHDDIKPGDNLIAEVKKGAFTITKTKKAI